MTASFLRSSSWLDQAVIGEPVYAIDDQQAIVRGTFTARIGAYVVIKTDAGERVFHERFVNRDLWPHLADLD